MDKIKGKVWKFRDSIDTDVIIAGRYLRTFNPEDLAAHVMEAEDPEFSQKVNKGDVIGIEGGDPAEDPNPGTSTGHHLHIEIRTQSGSNTYAVNPRNYIKF